MRKKRDRKTEVQGKARALPEKGGLRMGGLRREVYRKRSIPSTMERSADSIE